MSSSVGGVPCDTISWPKGPPFVHSNAYRQSGRDGNGHILGPKYSDPSTITATRFVADLNAADGVVTAFAALCSTYVTVVEQLGGSSDSTANVFIESMRVMKSNACVGPGGSNHVVIVALTVYMPVP